MSATAEALPLPEGLGGRLRYVRLFVRGWKQEELAEKASDLGPVINRDMVRRFEAGRQVPTLAQLLALAAALDVTLSQLGVTKDNFPELRVLGDMEELVRRIRCSAERRHHLRLVRRDGPSDS